MHTVVMLTLFVIFTSLKGWEFTHSTVGFSGFDMAFTNKEKQARKRARQKENAQLHKERLEEDRLRNMKAKKRAKRHMSKTEWASYRAGENARARKYRKPAKDVSITDPKPYKSAQAMGKAVKRVRSSMPYSPRKRLAVATAVAKEVGLTVLGPSTVPVVKRGLPENIAKEVQHFYLQHDITWQAPGRKDRVIIRERKEGKKVKTIIQARYMLMSLAEAHSIYCKESTNTIGLSKFCDLRPKQVKLFDTLPHNVCICPYHENVRLLLKALQGETGFPETTTEFVNALVCDASNKDCMTLQCPECAKTIVRTHPMMLIRRIHL